MTIDIDSKTGNKIRTTTVKAVNLIHVNILEGVSGYERGLSRIYGQICNISPNVIWRDLFCIVLSSVLHDFIMPNWQLM